MSKFSLSSNDEKQLAKSIPSSQSFSKYTFIADITVNRVKKIVDGGVSMSEHIITLNKRNLLCNYSPFQYIHILSIDYFSFTTDTSIEIGIDGAFYLIQSTAENILRFARYFTRNYVMINGIIPKTQKINFTIDDKYEIANPGIFLSPSQMFEALYNATCSYLHFTYHHEVTQFVHKLIYQENCIADFSRMPIHLMDNTYSTAIELAPIFDTLKFFPTISGIQIKDVGRPDFFYAIAPMVRESPNLRLISLEACNVSQGCGEFGIALSENPNLHLEYLDISDNPFEDLAPVAAALSRNNGNLWYLDFSNCKMSTYALNIALSSLIENQNLWDIIHLDFRDAKTNSDSIDLILHYLKTIYDNNHSSLRFLSFGKITSRMTEVIRAFCKYTQPIETLYLNDCKFDKDSLNEFFGFVYESKTLQELDVSHSNLTPNEVADLILSISKNKHCSQFIIKLNGLGLNGKNLEPVVSAFAKTVGFNWSEIHMDSNGMKPADVKKLVKACSTMRRLTGLSISCNMKKSQSGCIDAVDAVLNLPYLKKLWIHGNKSCQLGPGLKRVFNRVKGKALVLFDVAFNNIGDEGLYELQRTIEGNQALYELTIDGSYPQSIDTIKAFMTAASKSRFLRRMKFPVEDVFYLVKTLKTKQQRAEMFKEISQRQSLVQDQLLKNQTSRGLHNDLSEQHIPELDEMLDEMTAKVHDRLSIFKVLKHSGALLSIGLPFPNLNQYDDQEKNLKEVQPSKTQEEYGIQDAACYLLEKPDDTYQMHVKAINVRKGLAGETGLEQIDVESENDFYNGDPGIQM